MRPYLYFVPTATFHVTDNIRWSYEVGRKRRGTAGRDISVLPSRGPPSWQLPSFTDSKCADRLAPFPPLHISSSIARFPFLLQVKYDGMTAIWRKSETRGEGKEEWKSERIEIAFVRVFHRPIRPVRWKDAAYFGSTRKGWSNSCAPVAGCTKKNSKRRFDRHCRRTRTYLWWRVVLRTRINRGQGKHITVAPDSSRIAPRKPPWNSENPTPGFVESPWWRAGCLLLLSRKMVAEERRERG